MEPITPTPTHYFPARFRHAVSRSPSRSPSRRQPFTNQDLDSLLFDLSPSSTLEAPQANDIVRTGGKASRSFIQERVASASTSERAWGIKAALSGKKVREWYAEVGEWAWPGFDQPPLEEPTRKTVQYHQECHIDRSLSAEAIRSSGTILIKKQNVGALSSKLVQEYEERIEMIRDEMETLEIEDLKDYVRNIHFKAGSRRSSFHGTPASFATATDYEHLDDFTALITATIVQALPTISRLDTLLKTWSTRLLVLRQVPSFLADLDASRESMISASIAIGVHDTQQTKRRSDFSWNAFSDIQAVLQDQIAELGRCLDRMLDLLEGSADTLPDAWIDGLDNMETQYSAWVVKAERLAMNKELKIGRLEKDYTQDHRDEPSELDRPLDILHTTSTLDISAHLDEIRRRADGDFDLTRQLPTEIGKSENGAIESSTEPSAGPFDFDFEPFPSRDAFPGLGLNDKAHSQSPVVNSVDSKSLDGTSDGLKTPSFPSRPSHRPLLMLAGSKANVKRPDSPDAASDTSGSGSATSNYSSSESSPEIQSAVVAEYISSPVKDTSPTLLNREHSTQTEFGGANVTLNTAPSDLISKNTRRNGGSGHVRTRSASLQSFEVVRKHEIRKIQVQRSGSYSSALSLSDPEHSLVQRSRLSTSFAPQNGEPEALGTATPVPASRKEKNQQSSAPAQNLDPGLDMPKQHSLYRQPPAVSVKPSISARSSDREFHTPKQQLSYHSPPAVSPRPAHSAQSPDRELDVAEHRVPYHSPPAVPPRPAHSAQNLNRELDMAEHRVSYHSPPAVPPRPAHSAQNLDRELDMAEHRISYHSPPPVPSRSAHRFEQISDLGPGSTPVKIRQMKTSEKMDDHAAGLGETPRTTVDLSPSNLDDQLQERISSILTELSTQIRLTSGPEPDAPEVMRPSSSSNPRTPKTGSPAWRLRRAQTSTPLPSMTLAPAQPKSFKSRSLTGEPDIKLYHLHQTGKTAPIKLFVRLVGEGGERVMVRIGGGWADLGEYLREYASHHGQRSVSNSPFDIQGLPSSPLTNQSSPRSRPGSRTGSRPASPTSSTRQNSANRLARQHTSPAVFNNPHTPHSDPSFRTSPRTSWAGTDEASPSLGLAGPKTKNVDISPKKQAWVDELMEQARHSGPEKTVDGESAIGGLGKVGRTKRVFFKNRKER
ncbi:MAG: hypothetical protein ASARMPRED_001901 [Alectoria sarmentosa]|nr:MAG: hypothetical protein ASARMPRED_001901 [Alectoria sarmentosa]